MLVSRHTTLSLDNSLGLLAGHQPHILYLYLYDDDRQHGGRRRCLALPGARRAWTRQLWRCVQGHRKSNGGDGCYQACMHSNYIIPIYSVLPADNIFRIQIDLESSEDDIQEIQQEISVLSTCFSPYVTQYKASFLKGHKLWIVMEFLGGGSCLDLVRPAVFCVIVSGHG